MPYVGYILETAKKPVGFATLLGLPVAVIVFDEVKKIYKEVKKIKAKKREEENEEV